MCVTSTGLNPRQPVALSGISPPCLSRGSGGPRSWRTPTRFCPGSAGPTTLCWRTRSSYSSPLESSCEWWHEDDISYDYYFTSETGTVSEYGSYSFNLNCSLLLFIFSEWWYIFTLKLSMARGRSSVVWKSKLKMYAHPNKSLYSMQTAVWGCI